MPVIEALKPDSSVGAVKMNAQGELLSPGAAVLEFSGAVTAQTAANVITLTNNDRFDMLSFAVYALTGTTPVVKMYGSFDGTNFETTPLALRDLATGNVIAGTTGVTAIGNYALAFANKFKAIHLDYTAAVAGNCSIRGLAWKS